MFKMIIVFCADRSFPEIGGMESHGWYFLRYFLEHQDYSLVKVGKNQKSENECSIGGESKKVQRIEWIGLKTLLEQYWPGRPVVVFFNSGRWIEELASIRSIFPEAALLQRTGGNDIIKASLSDDTTSHQERQQYWIDTLNDNIDFVISNSHFTSGRLAKLGLRSERIKTVIGGVDSAGCLRVMSSRLENRNNLFKDKASQVWVGASGRAVDFKNLSVAVEAIAILQKKTSHLNFAFSGDGPLLEQLKIDSQRSLSKGSFQFLGNLTPLENLSFLSACDVVVSPSRDVVREVPSGSYVHTETMGRTILEAASCGTPVVAGMVGGVPEIFPRDYGVMIANSSTEEVCDSLMNCLKNGRPGVEQVRALQKKFSWKAVFDSYEKVWRAITSQ